MSDKLAGRDTYVRTDEIRLKNSIAMKGRQFSNIHKERLSMAHKGQLPAITNKIFITNELEELLINKEEFDTYKELGWRHGRLIEISKQINQKILNTKKQNGTKGSKLEEALYIYLCDYYLPEDIIREYKEERYPYFCDFYIKSIDFFIEVQGHWVHGGRPYIEGDPECEAQLAHWEWKREHSNNKYFQSAIDTWTIKDVEKLKCLNDNHLNYLIIYPINKNELPLFIYNQIQEKLLENN